MVLPLISIITPCLNRANFIGDAIDSVLGQNYQNFEHIIVDGGSTDGTLAILATYPHLKVVSEPDEGLYEAINKGIALASGEIIGHLNSDDMYEPGVFHAIAEQFLVRADVGMVSGGAVCFERNENNEESIVESFPAKPYAELTPSNVTTGVPIINARFFRREVYERVGMYSTRYKIASDREFLLRVIISGISGVVLDRLVYRYRTHEDSLTITTNNPRRLQISEEYLDIAKRYISADEVSSGLRSACITWHLHESTRGMLLSLLDGSLKNAIGFAARGWRVNPLWPRAFIGLCLSFAWRRLARAQKYTRIP
jgi:glycosyltransferase involved in cell wall biosynthesis